MNPVGAYGRVDILINNAAVQHVALIEQFPLDQWNRLIGVMLTGALLLTQAVVPEMRRNGWGRIINISSVNGRRGDRRDSLKWPQEDGSNWLHRVAAERPCDGLIWPHLRDTPWRLWRLELAPLHGERRPDGPDLLITKVEA